MDSKRVAALLAPYQNATVVVPDLTPASDKINHLFGKYSEAVTDWASATAAWLAAEEAVAAESTPLTREALENARARVRSTSFAHSLAHSRVQEVLLQKRG